MPDPTPLSEDVASSFRELTSVASALNQVSDALGKAVSDIDEGLRRLNLGITAWVRVHYEPADLPGDPYYYVEEIGYAKIDGKWGTALRTISGSEFVQGDEDESVTTYVFNEAPRALRIKAIDKIAGLLKALTEESTKVTKELEAKLADAQTVAAAICPDLARSKKKTLLQAVGEQRALEGLKPDGQYGTFPASLKVEQATTPEVKK